MISEATWTGRQVVSPALVGRDEELELLVAAVSEPPAVVVIEGEAGIGKTRLVAELRTHPAMAGRRLVRGGCHAIREPFPLGPVLEAVRGLRDDLASVRLSPVAGVLRPLLPELAELLPPLPDPLGNGMAERHRVFRGLMELLQALSPVTVVLEDLHWADAQTVDFLGYALGDPPGALSLVVTFRGEEVDPAVRALAGKLPATVKRAQLVLAPLDERHTGELAAAIVNADRVSADFAIYLCERTGGLPFAIEEVMALLRERGVVARHGHRWRRRTLDELAVPTAVRDHVLARAGMLPERARSIMEAVAVLQQPASERLITTVSRHPPAEVVAGLSQAIEAGLLVDDGEAVGFRHTLAGQAVYAGIPGPRRRDLHNRAAAALGSDGSGPLGQVAHHLRQAGRLAEWSVAAERAADQAVALGHYDEAARLYEEVLRHGSLASVPAGRVAVKLGWAAVEMLQTARVCDLLSAVLERDPCLPRPVQAELRYLVGVLLGEARLDPPRAHRLLRQSVEELADRPYLQARAMVALAIRSGPEDSFAHRKRWLDRVLANLPAVGDPVQEVFLLGKVASMLVDLGDPQWQELADRVRVRAGEAPGHRHQVNAYYSVGSTAGYVGHHPAADALLDTALAGAVGCGNERLEVLVRSAVVTLDYCRGRWQGLDRAAATMLERLAGYPRCHSMVESVAACLALARGDLDGAAGALTDASHRVEGGSVSLTIAVASLIRLALARGDPATAAAAADRYLAGQGSRMLWPVALRALPALVEALAAAGRAGEARSLVSRYQHGLHGRSAPLAPAALRHARGLLAVATGEPARAAAHFATAAARYGPLQCPYEAAQALEQAALARLAAGARNRIDEPLRSALTGYEQLGASWDLDRAARTARQHGVSVPARHRGGHRGYGTELSPRERQVAELAATGRTNKEIAGELYLSAETVKKHLQAAMRKLGVPSRAALARHLPPDPREQPGGSTPFGV